MVPTSSKSSYEQEREALEKEAQGSNVITIGEDKISLEYAFFEVGTDHRIRVTEHSWS